MFCLDWHDAKLRLYGNEKNTNFQRLEIIFLPCNYLHTHLGYEGDSVHPECVADLQQQIDYLGPLDFMIYHTQEGF